MATVGLVAHRIADARPTGIGRYYRELIAALAREPDGVRFLVVTPAEGEQPRWLPAGVAHREIPGHRRAVQFGWSALHRPRVDRWTSDADLVHALHAWAPVPTARRLVVTVHDVMAVVRPDWYRADHCWAIRRALRYAADHAERIVTPSAWVGSLLTSECRVDEERVRIVPEGVSDRFRVPPGSAEWVALERRWGLVRGGYLLTVGQVTARKNLAVVVRAMAHLANEVPLVVAGSTGPAARALLAEADRLGMAERLRLLGYVEDDALVPLIAGALTLVHPSIDEGFGLTPMEAMATGTPVIVSSAASLPEVVGDAAMVVAPTDVTGWAEALSRLIDDEGERARLIAAGQRRQEGFTWTATAQATLAVYAEVIEAT